MTTVLRIALFVLGIIYLALGVYLLGGVIWLFVVPEAVPWLGSGPAALDAFIGPALMLFGGLILQIAATR